MKKIVTIVGARPQFVKAAIVSRALQKHGNIHETIVHTGQHYDENMSKIFFDELEMPKIDYQLHLTETSHAKQTAEMLSAIEGILLNEKPDWLLIYGDTNSTLAGALAAAKLHIPIAHVEAGLRSYNRRMPEEINRLVADQLSSALFTPTTQSMTNLKNEGYPDARLFPVGDVMHDVSLLFSQKAETQSTILKKLSLSPKTYILATIHRAENTDDKNRLLDIFFALEIINKIHPVIIPLHPRTKKYLSQYQPDFIKSSQLRLIDPVGYLDMIQLEKNALVILTDSGGVQKEAFFYQVPCITLRDETEWIETIDLNWNRLVKPLTQENIIAQVKEAFNSKGVKNQFPYGKGNAAELIAKIFV
ncbi:MAG: UDP-N-acetylglucosamine 2-epimerase (non-hydrolyzing) [Gammaproteobacteria bacterium]|nr:UDP-N-acetylglucosamine 2-epimerase (non-hydrolyzing) [Gammaproteobacteria bacterium]